MRRSRRIGWLLVSLLLALVLLRSSWLPREVEAPGARESVATPRGEEAPSSPTEAEPEGVPSDDDRVPEPAASAPASWTLVGRVVTRVADPDGVGETERAVSGAEVLVSVLGPGRFGDPIPPAPPLLDAPVRTHRDGRFEVPGVPPCAKLGLTFRAPELTPRPVTVSTAAIRSGAGAEGARLDLGAIVLVEACDLEIHVVDPEGNPVDSARVLVTYGPESRTALTDDPWLVDISREATPMDIGRYGLEGVAQGQNLIEVLAPGYAPEDLKVRVPRPTPVEIELRRGGLYAGRVLDADGAPIEGARVWYAWFEWEDPAAPRSVTDSDGRFAVWGSPSSVGGEQRLRVWAESFAFVELDVQGPREDLELRLSREAVVSGRVVRKDDGAPLEGVSVSLNFIGDILCLEDDLKSETDAEGRFAIRCVPPGRYEIEADLEGFVPVDSEPVEVGAGDTSDGHLFELEMGFSSSVRVVDAETGEGIPGAYVVGSLLPDEEVQFEDWDLTAPSVTCGAKADSSGTAVLDGLREGEYELEASASGYFEGRGGPVHLCAGDATPIELSLRRGAAICGRALDPEGSPLPDVEVHLSSTCAWLPPDSPGTLPRPVFHKIVNSPPELTDSAGSYRFEGLPASDAYAIVARHKWFPSVVTGDLSVGEGEELSGVELRFPLGGRIEGVVVDPQGQPVFGAHVIADGDPGARPDRRSREACVVLPPDRYDPRSSGVQFDGAFCLEGLRPGTYRIKAFGSRYAASPEREVTVADGETVHGVSLVFLAGDTLSGRVIDALSGDPLGDVEVSVNYGARVRTGSDGTFGFLGVRPGFHWVSAELDGYASADVLVKSPSPPVVLRLVRPGCVRGRVHGAGRPLSGAYLSLERAPCPSSDDNSCWVDHQGRFDRLVRPGRYVLTVDAEGFGALRRVIDVRPGATVDLDLELRAGGAIEGVVVDGETGAPVANANVWIVQDGPMGPPLREGETEMDGTFLLDDAGPGVVDVLVTLRHGFGMVEAIEVRAGETARADVVLDRTSVLWGWVVRWGEPVGGVRVVARSLEEAEPRSAVTDFRGRWVFRDVSAEEHEIEVFSGAGEGSRIASLRDFPLNEVPTVIDLAGVTLRGRVLRGGEPAPASLAVWGPRSDSAGTDEGGTFVLRLPGPGIYGVEAEVSVKEFEIDEVSVRADVLVEIPPGVSEVVRDIEIREP